MCKAKAFPVPHHTRQTLLLLSHFWQQIAHYEYSCKRCVDLDVTTSHINRRSNINTLLKQLRNQISSFVPSKHQDTSGRPEEEEELPDWVTIYFVKNTDTEYKCNICEVTVETTEKAHELTAHIKKEHKDVYDIHKGNPETMVGFRVEFLHFNMMNDEGILKDDGDPKSHPVILGEVCEATSEEIIQPVPEPEEEIKGELLIKKVKKVKQKRPSLSLEDKRRRSWVWKYFHKMSNIIYRCNICNVVLSIKGCNTNNMNRHIRTRHPSTFNSETEQKKKTIASENLDFTEVETPFAIKTEEITLTDKEFDDSFETQSHGHRRSWIWLYFDRKSPTTAQCKLCSRNICHGGNATGNMNRHLKIIHNKTADDYTWIWKVFENSENDFYACKICQFRTMKFADADKTISCILHHLKMEHGVVSGDQIITGSEEVEEDDN